MFNLCESRKVCSQLPVVNPEVVSPGEEEKGEAVVLDTYKVEEIKTQILAIQTP